MHWIHLLHQTPKLSLAYLKSAQTNYISQRLGKIISHGDYLIRKCWTSHVIYGILYWKWKTEWLYECRTVVIVIEGLTTGCGSLAPSITREDQTTGVSLALGKDPNLKFKVQLLLNTYCFHIICKVKKSQVGHCLYLTSGNVHFVWFFF